MELPELENITGNGYVVGGYGPSEIHLPKVKTLVINNNTKRGLLYNVSNVKRFYMESLESMDILNTNSFFLGFENSPNDSLEEVHLPKLSRFYAKATNSSFIGANYPIKKIIFGKLTVFNYQLNSFILNNANLIHYEVGEGTEVSMDIKSINPLNAMNKNLANLIENTELFTNNLQQFLYNFRTYIIDRLYNYTGGANHTIKLHTNVLNIVLGLDEEGYANTFYMPNEPSVDYVTSLNQKLFDINWSLSYI